MGLGLGFKLSRSQSSKKDAQDEDPWYIPYNGPYEPPRQSSQRSRARDSWGDPIDDEDDGLDESLGVDELRKRFGGGSHHQYAGSGDLKPVLRGRSASLASGRSVASGVDPIHGGNILNRSNQRPPVASYINLNTSGGVGESPMPNASSREPNSSSRMSMVGSIFSFNSSHRKSVTSSKTPKNGDPRKPRPPKLKTNGEAPKVAVRLGPTSSSSSESQNDSPRKPLIPAPSVPVVSTKADDDDYYNSYYSTLLKGPVPQVSPEHPQFGVNPRAAPRPNSGSTVSQQETFSSHSIHPYAFTFPRKEPGTPIQEPPHSARDAPRLAFASPPPRSIGGPTTANGAAYKPLKNASSTPNLRSPGKPDSPKSNDRWLSARNWCDAILFPRPRLRIKEEPLDGYPIMSPPTTPLVDSHAHSATGAPAPVLTSRVLAHSRSLVDLTTKREPPAVPPTARPGAGEERPPRPKSFAQDDLALLRPVLSLEQVIEEGEELEKERKQWKQQATSSLGNTRARKLSRTRSKSLTAKGRQGHRPQTSFDYLAARACLGSQNLTPVLPSRSQTTSFSDARGALSSIGRSSHTQTRSNSISVSKSKSSQSHSRGHSKNESWSHSGSRPVTAPSPAPVTNVELDGKLAGIEGALRRDDARPLQGPTIVQPIDHPYANSPADRISPTPSGVSDIRMGIAISTPPLVEEVLDRETIRMPSHPYAQPGLVPNPGRAAAPSQASAPTPVAFLTPHPYAHPYSVAADPGDIPPFIAQPRSDDSVSPQNKMWAQLSPGVVREILPSDLRRYSPFLHEIPGGDRSSVVGVEEALKYTNHRDSPDSGLGTSETHIFIPTTTPRGGQRFASKPGDVNRPHREPVRYDASQPLYAHHRGRSGDASLAPPPIFPSSMDRPPVRPGLAPVSPSPAPTSGTASPDGNHSLGSPNDLDSFHDLFYKPNQNRASLEDNHPFHSSGSGVLTGDMALRTRRTGSGLTSLARQLSEEFEQMERERERTDSQYSRSSGSVRLPLGIVRRPTESSLQFVFEEGHRSASPMPEEKEGDLDVTEVFKPPFAVPEDVHSSNSSFVERTMEDDDDNTRMRVGVVESVSTPPAETAARRRSYTGFLSEGPENLPSPQTPHERHQSTLLSPATDLTRSSYMTTSTSGSRMSNLSDFPIPPSLPSHHDITLNPSLNSREAENPANHPMYPHDRRFTFGVDQDAADVADSLSNPDH